MTDQNIDVNAEAVKDQLALSENQASTGKERLESTYNEVKDNEDAQRFEAQGGLNEEERTEVNETLEDIQQARQERQQEKQQGRVADQSQEMSR